MQRSTAWEPTRPFSRALVIVAHPDDAEFGAGATIARLRSMGTAVHYVVLTDGASGSADASMTRERLAALREAEQIAACAELGVGPPTFLRHRDGYLEASIALRRQVAAEIRRHRPELIISLNPDLRWSSSGYVNHPDHRACGDLVLHSINPAASTRLWDTTLVDEGLEPWDVAELWMTGFGDGEHLVDVSVHFDAKIAALRRHETQLGDWDPQPRMHEMAATRGAEIGVALAEAFTALVFRVLDDEGSEPVLSKPPTNVKPSR